MPEIRDQISSIWLEIKETLKLNFDYAKLTATEKLTVLLSMIGLALVCFALASIIIFLISLGLMLLLAKAQDFWRMHDYGGNICHNTCRCHTVATTTYNRSNRPLYLPLVS